MKMASLPRFQRSGTGTEIRVVSRFFGWIRFEISLSRGILATQIVCPFPVNENNVKCNIFHNVCESGCLPQFQKKGTGTELRAISLFHPLDDV
jgi:hypothetical protein